MTIIKALRGHRRNKMRKFIFILLAGLAPSLPGCALAADSSEMNALMIVDSDSAAFNKDFQNITNSIRLILTRQVHF